MVIYIDVLIIINIFINCLILLCSAALLKERISKARLIIACIFGGVFSLTLLLPDMGVTVSFLIKTFGALGLTLIAFRAVTLRGFLRSFFCVLVISFVFAGIMLALYILIKPDKMALNNGAVYFEISVRAFVISAGCCYLLIKLFLFILKRRSPSDGICTLTIEANGSSVVLRALIDTGNSLTDVFTGKSVTTVEKTAVKRLLKGENEERTGVVPVKTALGTGMLETFRADRMVIDCAGKRFTVISPVLALSENGLSGAEYFALINPQIFENGSD